MLLARRSCVAFAWLVCAAACADDAKPTPLPKGAAARFGSSDFNHGGHINGFIVFESGKKFATLGFSELLVWDAATGRVLDTVALPRVVAQVSTEFSLPLASSSFGLTATADSSTLVALRNGIVHLISAPFAGAKPVRLPNFPTEEEFATFVAPFGKAGVVVRNQNGKFYKWEPGARELKPAGFALADTKGLPVSGGSMIASARANGVAVYDTAEAKQLEAIDAGVPRVVAVSADGKWVAVLARETKKGPIEVRSLADRKLSFTLQSSAVTGFVEPQMALSPSGARVAVTNTPGTQFEIFEVRTGALLHTIPLTEKGAQRLAFLREERVVALGSPGTAPGLIRVWDVKTGARVSPNATARVRALQPLPKGEWLAGGSDGSIVRHTDARPVEFGRHKAGVTALVLSTDGKTVYSSGLDGTVRAWELATGKELHATTFFVTIGNRPGPTDMVLNLALAPDGRTLTAGFKSGVVRLLNSRDLSEKGVLRSPDLVRGSEPALGFAGDGKLLVVRDSATKVRVWDVAQRTSRTFEADGGATVVRRMAVSPIGTTIAGTLATDDPNRTGDATDVGVWEIATGKLLHRIPAGTAGYVTAVAFLSDGKAVAVGDSVGVVRVFEIGAKEPKHTFTGHRGPVLCLALALDGKHLASGGSDATILVWKLE